MNWFTRLFNKKDKAPRAHVGKKITPDLWDAVNAHQEALDLNASIDAHERGDADYWEGLRVCNAKKGRKEREAEYKARYKSELEESRIKDEAQAAWDAVEAQKLEAYKLELEAIRDRDHLKLCRKLGNPWSMPKGIKYETPELKKAYLTPDEMRDKHREAMCLDSWTELYRSKGLKVPEPPREFNSSALSGRGAGQ